MNSARILDRAAESTGQGVLTNQYSLDRANFALTMNAPALSEYIKVLQSDYFKSEPPNGEPIGSLLGHDLLTSLDVDISARTDRVPEVNSADTLSDYHRQPPAKRLFSYVSEQIAGGLECAPSPEPLVNVAEAAHARRIEIIFAPAETRFNGAIYLREEVTKSVLNAAEVIQDTTRGEVTLKLYDGYRALEDQRRLFESYKAEFTAAMPDASEAEIWERLTQVVADPDLTPPHSTGGAVDLTLAWRSNHVELDMGSAVNELSSKASTWSREISPAQEYNRLLLLGAMSDVGFFNLPTEFWHYSIGDPYHALFCGEARARYAPISNLNFHSVICSAFSGDRRANKEGSDAQEVRSKALVL